MKGTLLAIVVLSLLTSNSWAARQPQSTVQDSRVRVVSYSPTDVVKITLHHGISTGVQFEVDETFTDHFTGLESAIQVTPKKNGLIAVKPLVPYADTNLTIITDRRTYLFEVKIRNPKENKHGLNDVSDTRLTYQLFYRYPDKQHQLEVARYKKQLEDEKLALAAQCDTSEFVDPSKLNYGYSMAGSRVIAPIAVFDDGQFTYFKFHKDTAIPSVFTVDAENNETVVNKRMRGDTLVVLETAQRFTLRRGKEVLTIRPANVTAPHKKERTAQHQGGGYASW